MKQLVQLQKDSADFKELNAELLFVFREESKGVEGLRLIQEKNNKKFTLAFDPKKKSTKMYSNGRMEFDNYVIDSKGIIRGVIDGTLRDRATANELKRVLKEIQDGKDKK